MRLTIPATTALAALLALSAGAQICNLPDGLTGNCCQQVVPTLPLFPPLSIQGAAICFEACAVGEEHCTKMELSPPMQTGCTDYQVNLDVSDCAGGAALLFGAMRLDYTRTWREQQQQGVVFQVWRFTAKADLSTVAAAAVACPVPSCLVQHPTAFYYGYVDYARNCNNGQWTGAAMLFHGCDDFQHDALLSDRPGNFHPTTSYALVMPDTAANPFVPSLGAAPGGVLTEEAVRNVHQGPGPVVCRAEEPLDTGSLAPIFSACLCPLAFNPPQVTVSNLVGRGTCPDASGQPSEFKSLNFWGQVPWFEMVSFRIGEWTGVAAYPGLEQVWADEGLFRYHDSCAQGGAGADYVEIEYGATTRGGYAILPVEGGPLLPNVFVDLASNFSHRTGIGVPIQLPVLGSVRSTDHLIYVNAD